MFCCYSVCEFQMGGSEGIVESVQIGKEGKASDSEAVDCKWYIRAPPRSKVSSVPLFDLGGHHLSK